MLAIRRILHPTDFSALSRPAFELACTLARDFGAELVVCHVSPYATPAVINGVTVDTPIDEGEGALVKLEQMSPIDPNVRVVHEWARGDTVREITRIAMEMKADLLVMGTHGRSGLSRFLMGSVAEGVMRKAPCPVLTVKAPPEGEPVPSLWAGAEPILA